MTDISTAEQSLADLKRQVAQLEAEQASTLREQARPVVETILAGNTCKAADREDATWVGTHQGGIEMTVNGRKYSVTVSVKDVEASKTRKDEVAARKNEKKAREEQADLLKRLEELKASVTPEDESDSPEA